MPLEISNSEFAKLEGAVKRFEKDTSAEILPVILKTSDDYPAVRWRFALGFSILLTSSSFFLLQGLQLNPYILFLSQILWLLLGYGVSSFSQIQRFFLLESKIAEEVQQRACEMFVRHRVHGTENRSGIMIFVSLLERRIIIIPDIGYAPHVDPKTFQGIEESIGEFIENNSLGEGIVRAIGDCASVAAKIFPPSQTKRNLVRDKPIITER